MRPPFKIGDEIEWKLHNVSSEPEGFAWIPGEIIGLGEYYMPTGMISIRVTVKSGHRRELSTYYMNVRPRCVLERIVHEL